MLAASVIDSHRGMLLLSHQVTVMHTTLYSSTVHLQVRSGYMMP